MSTNFDARAATWDEEPRLVQLAADIMLALRRRVPLRPDQSALDCGCGTGLLTLQLAPLVRRITGVDSSRGMLDVLRQKAAALGLVVETRPMDFLAGETLGGTFDLIVSSMTLHHVAHPAALFRHFHELLNPGGYLALADLDSEDGSFHPDPTGVLHHGFDRARLSEQLRELGFTDLADSTAAVVSRGRDYPIFLISARRPG